MHILIIGAAGMVGRKLIDRVIRGVTRRLMPWSQAGSR